MTIWASLADFTHKCMRGKAMQGKYIFFNLSSFACLNRHKWLFLELLNLFKLAVLNLRYAYPRDMGAALDSRGYSNCHVLLKTFNLGVRQRKVENRWFRSFYMQKYFLSTKGLNPVNNILPHTNFSTWQSQKHKIWLTW